MVAGGVGAGEHCRSTAPTAATTASVAICLRTSIGDDPLPLVFIPKHRCNLRFHWTCPGAAHATRRQQRWCLTAGIPRVATGAEGYPRMPRRARRPEAIPLSSSPHIATAVRVVAMRAPAARAATAAARNVSLGPCPRGWLLNESVSVSVWTVMVWSSWHINS